MHSHLIASSMLNEYSCACLHSDKKQQRQHNLASFKDGSIRFLICTDVAARGIDINELPYVISMCSTVSVPPRCITVAYKCCRSLDYTLPDTPEMYIHRVGRVGRADRMGLAISLVASHQEKVWYHMCANKGKGCHNTKLTTDGGCAIWYDEPQYLKVCVASTKHLPSTTYYGSRRCHFHKDIEKRLGQSIPELGDDLKWSGEQVMYGQKRDETAAGTTMRCLSNHVHAFADTCLSLVVGWLDGSQFTCTHKC
jgi:superfamily II DNA/RNA helicase